MTLDWKGVLALGGVVIGLYFVAKSQAKQALETINPVSENNIINQGIEGVGTALSGEPGWTLGGWLYDITHPVTDIAPTPLTVPPADAESIHLGGG